MQKTATKSSVEPDYLVSLIKIPVNNGDGPIENLEVSGLGTVHEDAQYSNIFSVNTIRKRYFLSYLFGLVCAYIPPISYLLNNPNSSFQVIYASCSL